MDILSLSSEKMNAFIGFKASVVSPEQLFSWLTPALIDRFERTFRRRQVTCELRTE